MRNSDYFIAMAHRAGYTPAVAQAALAWAQARLAAFTGTTDLFYIFRSNGGSNQAGAGSSTTGRPRQILAFLSADAALGFAQRARLGVAPRLISLSLAQLLAVIVQNPAITAIHIAIEGDDPSPLSSLPAGIRIERAELLNALAGVPS